MTVSYELASVKRRAEDALSCRAIRAEQRLEAGGAIGDLLRRVARRGNLRYLGVHALRHSGEPHLCELEPDGALAAAAGGPSVAA